MDISGQHIGPIVKGQEVLEETDRLAVEDKTDSFIQYSV